MLSQALKLARSGFLVFPVRAGEKLPLIKGWPEKATTDEKQVTSWWTQWPKANIGIHTKDLLVVDVDPKNGGFFPDKLIAGATLEVYTPSGGRHVYYHCVGGVKNSSGKIAPGVDIRSDRGYVLGPGSKVNGKSYSVTCRRFLINAPDWLVEVAGAGGAQAVEPQTERPDVDQEAAERAFGVWLMTQDEPSVGERNNRLAAVARKAGDLGLYQENVSPAILEWWGHLWDADERDGEVQKTIASAYRGRAQKVGGSVATDDDFETIVQENATYIPDEQTPIVNMIRPSDDDLAAGNLPEPHYLVKGWLEKDQLALLFGKWSAGKTFAALDIMFHVAAGDEWCGKRVRQAGALLFEYEGETGMRKRVAAAVAENPAWKSAPLAVVPMRYRVVDTDKRGMKTPGRQCFDHAIEAFKAEHGSYPGLIVIDPLRDALGGSDSDADLTAAYLAFARMVRKKTGACVLTLHHVGHGDQTRARGDSGIEAAMDVVVRAQVTKQGQRILTPTKERDAALPSQVPYRLKQVQLGMDSDGDAITSCVFEKMDAGILDPELTDEQKALWATAQELSLMQDDGSVRRKDISSCLKSSDNFDKNAFDAAWKTLVQKELLVRQDNGAYLLQTGAGLDFVNQSVLN